jgi:hypothetical protein
MPRSGPEAREVCNPGTGRSAWVTPHVGSFHELWQRFQELRQEISLTLTTPEPMSLTLAIYVTNRGRNVIDPVNLQSRNWKQYSNDTGYGH